MTGVEGEYVDVPSDHGVVRLPVRVAVIALAATGVHERAYALDDGTLVKLTLELVPPVSRRELPASDPPPHPDRDEEPIGRWHARADGVLT